MPSRLLLLLSLLILVACSDKTPDTALPVNENAADLVLKGGKIYTVAGEQEWAEAVAIKDGRIAYVGSNEGIAAFQGAATKVHDLGGRLMLPGFIDAHIHPISGGIEASACDLNELGGIAAYRARISEYAQANPDVEWVLGGGWSMAEFGPGAKPSKSILDELVSDRPVFLSSADGHSGWANSKALEIAGIDRNTPNPVDGIIDRDPDTGEAIGSLQEGAMSLVARHIPETSEAVRMQGLKHARDMLHRYGITGAQVAYAHEPDLKAYTDLDAAGELNLRLVAALWWERDQTEEQIPHLVELREKYTKGNVRATSVKIMQDGVMENYTAVMLEPYLLPEPTRGIPMVEPEFLKEAVTKIDEAGFQVHFHAIGDGAIRQALNAIEVAQETNGKKDYRHHISHLQLIDEADIPRFSELDIVANFQPLWAYADDYIVDLTIPFIGEDRAEWMYPIKSVIDAGGRVAFGSDWSVSTANPFMQIETAVTRVDAIGHATEVMNPEQRITVAQAIEAFTLNSAFVNHLDEETGSIETGKLADLIVVDQNLFEIDARDISDTEVVVTLFAGNPVYGTLADLDDE